MGPMDDAAIENAVRWLLGAFGDLRLEPGR
jgi:hypothetical protein